MPFNFFRKKTDKEQSPRKMATILDQHLGSYVKVMNINNTLKTSLILFGIALMFFNYLGSSIQPQTTEHIAMIRLVGSIDTENQTGNGLIFAESFERATKNENVKAILIVANSGGGSPVQAEMMNDVIAKYTTQPVEERVPVIVSMQDLCASACIMATSAADTIYAHRNSLVGSISVRMDGWGIDDALKRIGVERKVITTGKYKALLDPYRNLSENEKDFVRKEIMQPLHTNFVNVVKAGRGDKLDLKNELLFTGMIWSGSDSVNIGLIDEIKTTHQVQKDLKAQFQIDSFKNYNEKSFSFSRFVTSSIQQAITSAVKQEIRVTMNH